MYSNVIILQFEVRAGKPEESLATVKTLLGAQPLKKGSLVVLPELWAGGFDYAQCRQLAAKTPGLLQALGALAAEHDLVFAGTLLELPDRDEKPWNTLFIVDDTGVIGRYRKQHLFGLWREDQFFSAGDRAEIVPTPQGDIGPLVCYDLRFPELARKHAFQGAQLLVVSAQWPMSRLDHWHILLRARAIENQSFVVGVNSCGCDGEIDFGGHSMVVAPDGKVLAEAGNAEGAVSCALALDAVQAARSRFCSVGSRPWAGNDLDKICELDVLLPRLAKIRGQGSRVAFTNGCFDLLHSGHVSYLEQARSTADLLVVGLNSDRSVRALKGEHRPVNLEQDRARVLAALGCVDYIVIFDEDTPFNVITAIVPDVLVKGADWSEDEIVGAEEVKTAGGRVERVEFTHQCSTTALIEKIQK